MTFSIIRLSIMTFILTTLSITTFSIMPHQQSPAARTRM